MTHPDGTGNLRTSRLFALAEFKDAEQRKRQAEAEQFTLAAHWADLNNTITRIDDSPAVEGAERLVQWGGDGTPLVAEFCSLELSATMDLKETEARFLIADALTVRHRLPSLWEAIINGRWRVWRARDAAHLTRKLSYTDSLILDSEIAPLLDSVHPDRIKRIIKARVLEMLDQHETDARTQARRQRRVDLHPDQHDLTSVSASLDAGDALQLDATLNKLADILGLQGSADSRDVRRSAALGILANPARALTMLQAHTQGLVPEPCPQIGLIGHTCGAITIDPDKLLPRADLVVHLTDDHLATGHGVARAENIGPILTSWLTQLLGHRRIRVRPVLAPDQLHPVDAYEVPRSMREWVHLRNPVEPFPGSLRASNRGSDIDHTIPYQPGTPGQTRPGNLAPLSRTVHRAKTHAGWKVTQIAPGILHWTSPLGQQWLITPSHTWTLAA